MARILRVGSLILLVVLVLSGCWDYKGLDQIGIVAGIAVDYDFEKDLYELTFEIIELNAKIDEGAKTILISSEGQTIFESVRNAKRMLADKLYFSATHAIVLDYEYAEKIGIYPVLDWIMRDAECRATLVLAISQMDTAKEVLSKKLSENTIVSAEIREIIDEDYELTLSTAHTELYEVYATLGGEGFSASVASVCTVDNNGKDAVKVGGLTHFYGDRAIGHMPAEDTKYFLFALDGVGGGILPITVPAEGLESVVRSNNVSLEISKSKTKRKATIDGDEVTMKYTIETDVFVGELHQNADLINKKELAKIKAAAEKALCDRVYKNITDTQAAFNSDLYGIGNYISKHNNKDWKRLSDRWDDIYQKVSIEVECTVNIINSGFVKGV